MTAVPALGVIAEAMVALALADAMLEKFGGDSLGEMRRNYQAYVAGAGRPLDASRAPEAGEADARATWCSSGCPAAGRAPSASRWPRTLGAPLFDIDSLLVREMGMPVAQIFGMVGEPRFREMEQKAVLAAVAAEEPAVIVPGGGWAAQPGQMHGARRVRSPDLSALPAAHRRQAGGAGRGPAPAGGPGPGGADAEAPGGPGTVLQAR